MSGGNGSGGSQTEMVEKLAHDFGDVMDGKKSWKDMLRGFIEEAGGVGSGSERGESSKRRRDR